MEIVPLNKDNDFVVVEAKVLDYIMAFIFFVIFLYGLIDTVFSGYIDSMLLQVILILFGFPAIIYFVKARSRRIYIRINKMGIFQDEKLVTNWKNFLNAYIKQKEVVGSIKDNFVLVVEYLKDGSDAGFRRKIPLTNTQNKSEEEIYEAIQFFLKEYNGN